MANAFREPGQRASIPVCEGCRKETDQSALQFGPDGRQLCRMCFGQLQAAQADYRSGHSPGTGFFGRMMRRNPANFVRLAIVAIFMSFFMLVAAVSLAGAAGEWLSDFWDAHRHPDTAR